jgi:APA family basic amino acid/polyamine antiporter
MDPISAHRSRKLPPVRDSSQDARLIRAIGIVGLTAAIVNVTVGGGIYRLPAAAAQGLGNAAWLSYVVCALALAFIVICFAEAGSRVSLTGGVYAYVEVALGPFAGLLTGVLLWAGLTATFAAVVSFLADAVGALAPSLAGPGARAGTVLLVLGVMTALNVRGVRLADRFNALATLVKLLPLLVLLVGGLVAVDSANLAWTGLPPLSQVAQTSAVLIFAFLGIETALVPSGEVRDPERTVPRAILLAIAFVVVLYLGLHLVAQGVLGSRLGEQKTPLAEAAGVALGPWARQLVLGASALSMLVYVSGMMLGVPRLLFAFARDGFAPSALARIHDRFQTPHHAIAVQALLVAALAVSGTFERLALLGNAAVLLCYAACCAAAWQLRRKDVRQTGAKRHAIPGAAIAPPVALLLIGWLLTAMTRAEWLAVALVALIAAVVYAARRAPAGGSKPIGDHR